MESSDCFQQDNHEIFSSTDQTQHHETDLKKNKKKKKKKKEDKGENKRRFSGDQIRSLECIFESETKLEPRKKVQVARELGLHPRQVSIWFQNRRARGKSKQIEQEYRKLREDYDSLSHQFESLKKEKESLQAELQKLGDLLGNFNNGVSLKKEVLNEHSLDGCDSKSGHMTKPFSEPCERVLGEDGGGEKRDKEYNNGYLEDKRNVQLLQRMGDEVGISEGPLASLEKWCSVDQNSLLDLSGGSSQWLNFWI